MLWKFFFGPEYFRTRCVTLIHLLESTEVDIHALSIRDDGDVISRGGGHFCVTRGNIA